ncbi:VWA domain-containing protein [Paraflavisolibacter sp. H34]|uniref:vWA domain-containing protein n=1 Tax=Huijunlia imazamoxiresistens TaxID=3127457 RepID=UPI00301AD0CE
MLQFQYPQAFWALAALPLFFLIYWLNVRWKRQTARRIGNPELVKTLFRDYSPLKFAVRFGLVALAFALGCLALANPRVREDNGTGEARKGIDIMMALDVSNSMLANDVQPNRLAAAKALMQQLMNRLPNDRIGLVLFAGSAYVTLPLTFDHEAAGNVVSVASPRAFGAQGTAIGEALGKCDFAFGEESRRFKAVVLISDGETHDEKALDAAKQLAERGVTIHTVGVGSSEGASIVDTASGGSKRDASGNVVISKLNEQLLREVASSAAGTYSFLNNPAEVASALVTQLGQIEKTTVGDASQFQYTTLYLWPALPMLLLLVAELFLTDKKRIPA